MVQNISVFLTIQSTLGTMCQLNMKKLCIESATGYIYAFSLSE